MVEFNMAACIYLMWWLGGYRKAFGPGRQNLVMSRGRGHLGGGPVALSMAWWSVYNWGRSRRGAACSSKILCLQSLGCLFTIGQYGFCLFKPARKY